MFTQLVSFSYKMIDDMGDSAAEAVNPATSISISNSSGESISKGNFISTSTTDSSPAPSFDESWSKCLALVEAQIDPQVSAAYIRPLKFISFDRNLSQVVVATPSRLVLNHIEQNYRSLLEQVVRDTFNAPADPSKPLSIRFEIDTTRMDQQASRIVKVRRPQVIPNLTTAHDAASRAATSSVSNVNTRYTFDNFVVGNSNQFCHAAAVRSAEEPGKSYNPLFIYGGVGLGKTHLLHAIGNAVLQKRPSAKVLYMSSETFTNELIQSLRNAKMDEFKSKIRGIEVLLIDDIQFIVGKERTQEEFFHTFNALYSAHHQIVITSDKTPQDIPGIEERLQTRFSWGLTADLQAPDFETRVAIINRKATNDGFSLPADIAHFIAEKVSSNVRELEGALTRLHAITSLQHSEVTMELAKNALKPFLQRKAVNITSDDIKRAVAQHFGVKTAEMVSKRRTKSISFPRHVAMYLCRKHTTLSYPEIGGEFGGRDHSSVIHAAQVVSSKLTHDSSVKNIIVEIEKELLG